MSGSGRLRPDQSVVGRLGHVHHHKQVRHQVLGHVERPQPQIQCLFTFDGVIVVTNRIRLEN